MEIKRIKAVLAGMVIIGLTLTACSGDDGDTGPRGPAGVDGQAGADGVANISSNTFNVQPGDWSINSDTSAGIAPLTDASITADVINSGLVMVYQNNNGEWVALPYQIGVFSFGFTVSQGQVTLRISAITGGAATLNNATEFRVVVIPPAAMVEGVDVNNFDEVQAVYGLKELDFQGLSSDN